LKNIGALTQKNEAHNRNTMNETCFMVTKEIWESYKFLEVPQCKKVFSERRLTLKELLVVIRKVISAYFLMTVIVNPYADYG